MRYHIACNIAPKISHCDVAMRYRIWYAEISHYAISHAILYGISKRYRMRYRIVWYLCDIAHDITVRYRIATSYAILYATSVTISYDVIALWHRMRYHIGYLQRCLIKISLCNIVFDIVCDIYNDILLGYRIVTSYAISYAMSITISYENMTLGYRIRHRMRDL